MAEITLRDYQKRAVEKAVWSYPMKGNDLMVLATGAGKSLVIGSLVNELKKECLILQPSREILTQNYEKLCRYVPKSEIGIYSASLKRKDIRKYTFATIQSVYKKPDLFDHIGLVIIDECDTMKPKDTKTMYGAFLKALGDIKCYGLTATPYRNTPRYEFLGGDVIKTSTSLKLLMRGIPTFWSRVLCNIGNRELVEKGYLSPLEYEDAALMKQSQIKMNYSGSDFDLDRFAKDIEYKHETIIERIHRAQKEHKSVLVFCSTVLQAKTLSEKVNGSYAVYGEMKDDLRDNVISLFKSGKIKTVFNVGVLTCGFDHPDLDCIVMVRPTKSLRLWYQMLGRGSRIAEGKTSCKVIDFTDTVSNLGRIETIELKKVADKWELFTETGSFHNRELYSCTFKKKKKKGSVNLNDTIF